MKYLNKYLYITLLLLAGLLVSCIDDTDPVLGDKLEITVSNIESDIRINIGETLTINPSISPEDREYECFWGIANKNNTYSVIDTISYERALNYKVDLETGTYTLRFCAKDKATGIFSYTQYNLSVETEMSTGWWVLKSGANGTDVDLFTPEKRIADIVYNSIGKGLKGEPVDMAYASNYFIFDPSIDADVNHKTMFITSEEDLMVVDYFTGKVLKQYEDMFLDMPAQRKIQGVFKGSNDVHLVADGQLYTLPTVSYTSHYRQFIIKHTGNYSLSPYRVASGYMPPMLFDEASSSFCIVDRGSTELLYGVDNASPSHRNLDSDLIYMGGRTTSTGGGEEGYAILKKKNANEYTLARIDATKSTYDLTSTTASRHCVIMKTKSMPNTMGVLSADIRALSQDNDIMYYAKDNKVYMCNLETETMEEREQTTSFSAGETITYMEFAKFMQPYNDTSKWFSYLVIGTQLGDTYKLYLHPVQGGNIQPAVTTYEGTGKVKRAIYIANLSGTIYPAVYL